MAKSTVKYVCANCGAVSLKYAGKCFECQSWGTLQEIRTDPAPQKAGKTGKVGTPPVVTSLLETPEPGRKARIQTGLQELDRVLGGGLMPSSVIMVGGEPGIGKSTLMLQITPGIHEKKILYVCGEESPSQVKDRAARLGIPGGNLWLVTETILEGILEAIAAERPDIVIIDSIQTIFTAEYQSSAGTITQIRECAAGLTRAAKQNGFVLFIIGHITKAGSLAGPKTLEHMVDTVLQFEGEGHQRYRMIRSIKNRFGPTNEIGVFRMEEQGLQEVRNPSEFFIADRSADIPGNSVHAAMEGSRPLLVEVQALVSKSGFSMPQRISSGFDIKRLNIILAVLEKRLQLPTWGQDVFIRVAGGLKLLEPAADLAIAVAIASGIKNTPCSPSAVCAGEIGLSGELRAVSHAAQRAREAAHLGFRTIILPEANTRDTSSWATKLPVTIKGCRTVQEALDLLNL
ncbi:DNA repair protein RadA [Prosthecochloris sp. CIB 2401]|uniref:DNA repair protein RadA n=1 Tax=Prosthecochloris sp. CIB 2401 TaxID=1868325 RepID=UPI00080ABA78|nr:DNA repair protein RadA [Prosthecochloris sp. CIB 2401]ANT64983.1 DNA repair protein RadA [Prosthecochloris sp. CIB 2401]